LADAGFTAEQVRFLRARRDKVGRIAIYEVDFKMDGREYEYKIHAGTGVILRSKGKRASAATLPAQVTQPSQSSVPGVVCLEKAREIALMDAGFAASQVTFKRSRLAKEDGVAVYRIKFEKDGRAYAYWIHTRTGEILSKN
jgi:uncharacterized membrane protein YkoI